MILIWSGDGGPLQYLSLAIVFLQFFAPHLLDLTAHVQDGAAGIGAFPLIWITCSLVMGLWVVMDVGGAEDEGDRADANGDVNVNVNGNGNGNGNNEATAPARVDDATSAAAPSGSAANPVVIDDDDAAPPAPSGSAANPVIIDDDDDVDDNLFVRVGELAERVRSLLRSLSSTHVKVALGFLVLLAALNLHAATLTDSGVLQITVLAIIAHSMMAIAAYRVLRDVLDGEGDWNLPAAQTGGRRRRGRKLTVSEITNILRKVPVEEFVSEKDVKSGACSVTRLKRMLVNRGRGDFAGRCNDKDELCKELLRVRNFNEECPISAEEYAEGSVLRVTPCRHEFNLHCFDQWMYTYATDSRQGTQPMCPLCKTIIE